MARGKEILSASWQMLRQDRHLLWLPVISTGAGILAAAVFFLPAFALSRAVWHDGQVGFYIGGVLAAFALSIVTIYFQAALVIGAYARADGHTPTLGGVLRETWTLRRQVLGWAVVTTVVGAVLRAVEERLSIVGKLLGLLAGITWAIASFLAVPVLVAERLGPIAAVKRSSQLLRQIWGTGLRTTVRFGIVTVLIGLAALGLGITAVVMAFSAGPAFGIAAAVVVCVAMILIGSILSAVFSYAQALIYRYATGRPVPGVAPVMLAAAFAKKRRWR
ncbi:MAG TPA: DUF6159 family protein [Jatrophihabitantaceae bacterium]|jgi:hypothetical protein|nr:DUF6159 family protein [Jatrophihabitantaceae bacterium]